MPNTRLEEGKCNNSAHESDGRKVQQWCEQARLHPDCGVRAKENRQLLILSLLTLYLPLWIPLSLQSTASNIFILYSFCPFDCYTTSPLAFQTAVATFYGSNKLSKPFFMTVSNILILFANVFQMHPLYLLPFHFFGSAFEVNKKANFVELFPRPYGYH